MFQLIRNDIESYCWAFRISYLYKVGKL